MIMVGFGKEGGTSFFRKEPTPCQEADQTLATETKGEGLLLGEIQEKENKRTQHART